MEENLQQVTGLVGNLSSLLNEISTATLSQGDSIHQMTRQLQALNQVSRQTDLLVSTPRMPLSGCKAIRSFIAGRFAFSS